MDVRRTAKLILCNTSLNRPYGHDSRARWGVSLHCLDSSQVRLKPFFLGGGEQMGGDY